jgi:hypothetical protein
MPGTLAPRTHPPAAESSACPVVFARRNVTVLAMRVAPVIVALERVVVSVLGIGGGLAGVACGGNTSSTSSEGGLLIEWISDAGGAESALPACAWPASLGPTDADNGQCVAARANLSCSMNGAMYGLLSNDPMGSPACQDECEPGEYGIFCGRLSAPPAPAPPAPAGCRRVGLVSPSDGAWVGCCPCGG